MGGRPATRRPSEQEQLDALRRLASVLGAHLLVERGDDVAMVAQRVARERGTTYVLMGPPGDRGAVARLRRPALPLRLLRLLPGVDLRIVADRTLRTESEHDDRHAERADRRARWSRSRRSRTGGAPLRVTGRAGPPSAPQAASPARILFPFVAHGLSPRALDAALRLARAEDATLVPVFLARVAAASAARHAAAAPVDDRDPAAGGDRATRGSRSGCRSTRGSSGGAHIRHALRQTIAHEQFDRIVIAAANGRGPGFDADDVAWLLTHAPGEIVVLRPDPDREVDLPAGPVRAARRRPIVGGRPQTGRGTHKSAG